LLPDCLDIEAGCQIVLDGGGLDVYPFARDCECPTFGACEPSDCYERTVYCTLPPGSYSIRMAGTVETIAVSQSGARNFTCAGDF
jgi:hypothetical protein